MRVVAEVPHPRFKITIFSWNEKYIIKVEISTYEQSFKIEHGNVDGGLEQVKAMIDQDFLDNCNATLLNHAQRFWKRISTCNPITDG